MQSIIKRGLRGLCVVGLCMLVTGSSGIWAQETGFSESVQVGIRAATPGGATLPGLPDAPYVFMGGVAHLTDTDFETTQAYQIGDNATLNVHDGARARLAGSLGNMFGSMQGVTKLGAGALLLAGANTYRGTTRLLQGHLTLAHNSAAGWGMLHANTGTALTYAPGIKVSSAVQAASVDLASTLPAGWYTPGVSVVPAGEVHWRVGSGQAEHAGLLLGDARLVKQGSGRLNLTGDALPFAGEWVVNDGALAVNTALPGAVQVNNGARLEGTGSVGLAQILAGGVLAPGNSIGTLTVQGDLVFQPGSVFEVEANPNGQADRVNAGGVAQLAGTVRTLASAGAWQPQTQVVILHANGGLAGTRFDTVTSNLAFLTPSLGYGASDVTLTLTRNDVPLTNPAQTPDEETVAEQINDGPGNHGGSPNPGLFGPIVGMDADTARDAYRQLGGSWLASVQSGLMEDSRFLREAVLGAGAMRVLGGVGQVPEGGRASGSLGWARVFHADRFRAARDGQFGDTRSVHGLFAGGWQAVAPNVWLGGVLGGQFARMSRQGGGGGADARADSFHLGVNMAWRRHAVSAVAGLAYSWHRVRTGRVISAGALRDTLSGAASARTAQVFGEAAWKAWQSGWLSTRWGQARYAVSPFLRLAAVQFHQNAFNEDGGPAALGVQDARHNLLFSQLGLRGETRIRTATGAARARLSLAWRHARGDTQVTSVQRFRHSHHGQLFASSGQPVLKNALHIALDVAGQVSRSATVALGYSGVYGAGVQDHGVQLNWRGVF